MAKLMPFAFTFCSLQEFDGRSPSELNRQAQSCCAVCFSYRSISMHFLPWHAGFSSFSCQGSCLAHLSLHSDTPSDSVLTTQETSLQRLILTLLTLLTLGVGRFVWFCLQSVWSCPVSYDSHDPMIFGSSSAPCSLSIIKSFNCRDVSGCDASVSGKWECRQSARTPEPPWANWPQEEALGDKEDEAKEMSKSDWKLHNIRRKQQLN